MAREFRIFVIDADPGAGAFAPGQIRTLQAGGRNRVLSYFNLGSVERDREYWDRAPAGFLAARDNRAAQLGRYQGYPDEVWMNAANPAWQRLLVDHVAARLVRAGVDGFYFDNLEVAEHRSGEDGHVCDRRCAQGAFDLVRRLREKYPDLLFVMQNAASDVTRTAVTGGKPFAGLLDGLAHEDTFTTPSEAPDAADVTYRVRTDDQTVAQLAAWQRMGLRPGGRPFWTATEDYVNSCANAAAATAVFAQARRHGFAAYVSDKSALQQAVCFWPPRVRGP